MKIDTRAYEVSEQIREFLKKNTFKIVALGIFILLINWLFAINDD